MKLIISNDLIYATVNVVSKVFNDNGQSGHIWKFVVNIPNSMNSLEKNLFMTLNKFGT